MTLWTGRISFAIVEAVAVDLSAAKVGQNPGAKTKMTSNRKLGLGTDIAHLFLYDPDRLDYAKTWPIDWFNAPEVWQHVSRAGDMVAWCTRSDGGYAVRLTTDGLTEAETPLAGASWTFPLRSTGRVLIDGGDLLPNEDRAMGEPHDDQWVELAPGLWHVTVTAIEWTASALPEEEASKLFANYVVSFAPAGDAPAPAIARRPPDLVCLRAEPANDSLPEPIPAGASARKGPDLSAPMPAGQAAKVVAPPGHFTSEGESDLLMSIPPGARTFDAFKLPYFMAPSLEVGAVGQVCRLSGSGGAPGKPPRFSLTAQATARITEIIGRLHEGQQVPMKKTWFLGAAPPPLGDYAAPLLQVRVEAVEPNMTPPDDIPLDTFRAALLTSLAESTLAETLGGKARFHHLVLSASDNYPQLATFALRHLPMDKTERTDLSAMDFAPRVRALLTKLS